MQLQRLGNVTVSLYTVKKGISPVRVGDPVKVKISTFKREFYGFPINAALLKQLPEKIQQRVFERAPNQRLADNDFVRALTPRDLFEIMGSLRTDGSRLEFPNRGMSLGLLQRMVQQEVSDFIPPIFTTQGGKAESCEALNANGNIWYRFESFDDGDRINTGVVMALLPRYGSVNSSLYPS